MTSFADGTRAPPPKPPKPRMSERAKLLWWTGSCIAIFIACLWGVCWGIWATFSINSDVPGWLTGGVTTTSLAVGFLAALGFYAAVTDT